MRVVDMFNIICKLCGNFVSMFDTENLICWWLSKIQSSASFQTYIFIESFVFSEGIHKKNLKDIVFIHIVIVLQFIFY